MKDLLYGCSLRSKSEKEGPKQTPDTQGQANSHACTYRGMDTDRLCVLGGGER